ncbi:MAG: hypothetical protein IPM37_07620 [Hahellaceae bacterium]|nr:hypothetical protein [Hahellaceae bacterium]
MRHIEALALAHGLRVGMWPSPHLIQFNERIRLQGEDATDALICEGFRAVEQLRGDVPLTYFEIMTLVAFWLFARQSLDLVILEVGLGGRPGCGQLHRFGCRHHYLCRSGSSKLVRNGSGADWTRKSGNSSCSSPCRSGRV